MTPVGALVSSRLPELGARVLARCLPLHEGDPIVTLTYGEVDRQARWVAHQLLQRCRPGDRALVMLDSEPDFVVALFGCLYAGVVAVPVHPPDTSRRASAVARADAVVRSCDPAALVTTREVAQRLGDVAEAHPTVLIDRAGAQPVDVALPELGAESVACLQYSSGSTGDPKGVVLTHGNLLANLELFRAVTGLGAGEVVVNWMPLFHDLGLSIFLFAPLIGGTAVLMPPEAFLRRPARWLEAIGEHGGAFSGAPNFAYELCATRVSDAEIDGLDLSRWRASMNAAEPVRRDTIERFTQRFARAGLSDQVMMPCYGLAEATAFATAGRGEALHFLELSAEALREGVVRPARPGEEVRTLVGCGSDALDSRVVIVRGEAPDPLPGGEGASAPEGRGEGASAPDPHPSPLPEGEWSSCWCDPPLPRIGGEGRGEGAQLGEIWLTGPQVGLGYWGLDEASAHTFGARLPGDPRPFLRTGDLGFLWGGQLFVAGRVKDLIVVRGRNHHPQDLELTVERCHRGLRAGCVAAFAVDADGEEAVAVVAEVRETLADAELPAVGAAIREAVAAEHGVLVHELALLPPRTVNKTSSGKIQRRACRDALASGGLPVRWRWRPAAAPPSAGPAHTSLEAWLAERVAHTAGAPVDLDRTFHEAGLDSQRLLALLPELEARVGRRLSPAVFFDFPTPRRLARHLTGEVPATSAPTAQPVDEPVAIIGLACRLPGGVVDLPSLWRLIEASGDAVTEVPADRWDTSGESARHGAFLDDIAGFDAVFFGLSRREAAEMDPQQRLLLEVGWEAFEDAGCTAERLEGSNTGVFVGISGSDYASRGLRSGDPARINPFSGTATATSVAAGRLAYSFGLAGPAMAIDTACSSSLVALHTAVGAIRDGACDRALVAGVNLILDAQGHRYLSALGALAADGRCKVFDAAADGYVRGEGCVAVVVTPLSRALRDGARVLGVIRGTAVNHDGRTNGLTAPSGTAQRGCYRHALDRAGLQPHDIDYVEAHGTGTPLGDPIELGSLAEVYGPGRDRPLRVGSVKAHLGHQEAAAGLTGLAKVLAMFEARTLPRQPLFDTPSPQIPWDEAPIEVLRAHRPWSATGTPRRAAVSSFGISGTNAHVVLEEPPPVEAPSTPPAADSPLCAPSHLLPVSARSRAALAQICLRYAGSLERGELSPDDLAFSASVRRSHHPWRAAVVADGAAELALRLRQVPVDAVQESRAPRVVLVFPGHGSQWGAMATGIADLPGVRQTLDACEVAFAPYVDWSLREVLDRGEAHPLWGRVDVVQPTLFAMELAIAELWRSWGVRADAVLGHSMGEVAAFHYAGVLTLDDAARVICRRSAIMRRLEGQGAMLVLGLPREQAEVWIAPWADELAVAVHNSLGAVVLSGSERGIAAIQARAERLELFARRVKIDVASHSPQAEACREAMLEALAPIRPRAPQLPVLSSVDVAYVEGADGATAAYWFRNLRQSVRFVPSVQKLAGEARSVFVEVSPHPVLTTAVQDILTKCQLDGEAVASLRRDQPAEYVLKTAAASLYASGIDLDWARLNPRGRPARLPPYPFERERHWIDAPSPRVARPAGPHPLLGPRAASVFAEDKPWWPVHADLAAHPWLAGHEVYGAVILPAAAVLDMVLAAGSAVLDGPARELTDVRFQRAFEVRSDDTREVQLAFHRLDPSSARWALVSRGGDGPWVEHALGAVSSALSARPTEISTTSRAGRTLGADAAYAELAALGLNYQGVFRGLSAITLTPGAASATVDRPHHDGAWVLHPGALDACLQALGLAQVALDPARGVSVPARIGRLSLHGAFGRTLQVEAKAEPEVGQLVVRDARGDAVVTLEDVRGTRLGRPGAAKRPAHAAMALTWQALPEARPIGDRRAWAVLGAPDDGLAEALRAQGQSAVGEVLDPDGLARQVVEHARGGCTELVVAPAADADPVRLVAGLAQALAALGALASAPRLTLVTCHAQPEGGVAPDPAHAALWGVVNVAELEVPTLALRRVDRVATEPVGHAVAALLADDDEERVVVRGGRRLAMRLAADVPLEEAAWPPLSPGGTTLVSGGFGALGAVVARQQVDAGARHVVLLSRGGACDAPRRALVDELRRSGAQVLAPSVDLSHPSSLAEAASAWRHWPPVTAVFHAAGVLGDRLLGDIDLPHVEAVFAAKVRGLLHLEALTAAEPVARFVVFSSGTAVLGSPGQAAYGAANAALDAWAQGRVARGLPAQSLRLGPVAEVGMAAPHARRMAQRGVSVLEPAALPGVLGALLAGPAERLPFQLDLDRFAGFHPRALALRFLCALGQGAPAAVGITELRALAGPALRQRLEQIVQDEVARILGVEPDRVSRQRSVQELGFDSVAALELGNRLARRLDLELPATFVWRHPSVTDLAEALQDQLGLDPGGDPAAPGWFTEPERRDDLALLRHLRTELEQVLIEGEP